MILTRRAPGTIQTPMIEAIQAQLNRIESYAALAAKKVLTMDDAALLSGFSKSTLYRLTSEKVIPHYKPNGRIIMFDRAEFEGWLKTNRVAPESEINARAAAYNVAHT